MAVTRTNAITGEQLQLSIIFREDNTASLFDPYSVDQVDILAADGQTVIETIPSGSITKVGLGEYQVTTTNPINSAGLILDRWMYRLEDGGIIHTSIEVTNVVAAPEQIASVESSDALPRNSAVILRPILLTMEFRDDKTGELFDPYVIRQVDILESNATTIIESITSINRIGIGRYRVQASAISTPKVILDRWFFTAETGEEERFHIQDTQIYDQAALGAAVEEELSVPELLFSDLPPTDQEIVLCNTVERVGITFKDSSGTEINPAQLSLEISTRSGANVLADIYLPDDDRDPDPPRILNPSAGRFEFPFGLDNNSTDGTKKNRTTTRGDYIFKWRAASRASSTASVTINPGINPDSTIVWTAVPVGTPGNFISIEYVNPGTPNAQLGLVRDGSKVTINLETDAIGAITTQAIDIINEVVATGNEEVAEIVTASLPVGGTGLGIVGAVASTVLTGGVDSSDELLVCQSVKIVNYHICSLIQRLRLQIDKAVKLVSSDPENSCYLGYTEGQLVTYLEGGLQAINSYQPSGCFNFENFPYDCFGWILIESSLLVGVMSQYLFAVDTDIPNWSDQGNVFVIQHAPQLATYLNWLTQRLDKMIPQMKLNFVSSGSLHIQMGPNYRLAQLISAAPNGALFRNMYYRG